MKNIYKIVIKNQEDAEIFLNSSYSNAIDKIYSPVPLLEFKHNRKINYFLFWLAIILFFCGFLFQFWTVEYYKIFVSGSSDFQIILAPPFAFTITIFIISIAVLILFVVNINERGHDDSIFINSVEFDNYIFILKIDKDLCQTDFDNKYKIEKIEKIK